MSSLDKPIMNMIPKMKQILHAETVSSLHTFGQIGLV